MNEADRSRAGCPPINSSGSDPYDDGRRPPYETVSRWIRGTLSYGVEFQLIAENRDLGKRLQIEDVRKFVLPRTGEQRRNHITPGECLCKGGEPRLKNLCRRDPIPGRRPACLLINTDDRSA